MFKIVYRVRKWVFMEGWFTVMETFDSHEAFLEATRIYESTRDSVEIISVEYKTLIHFN